MNCCRSVSCLGGLLGSAKLWVCIVAISTIGLVSSQFLRGASDAVLTQAEPSDDSPTEEKLAGNEKGVNQKEADKGPEKQQAEREEAFRKLLSGAVLAGVWRLADDKSFGEEEVERYTLGEVHKVEGSRWRVQARIQFGDKDVTIPVPVHVHWADDTPILSVTDLGLPGLGKYTARVMFYRDLYTGTWFGPGHGGFLSGRIERPEGESPDDDASSAEKREARD